MAGGKAASLAQLPSVGRIMLTGAGAVLVPGLAVFAVLLAAGAATSVAGMLGLLAMLCGLGWFPFHLRRISRALRSARAGTDGAAQ